MSMTREDYLAKQQIRKILAEGGYPTYAYLVGLFDINLTNDPNMIAAMDMNKGRIIVNRFLDTDQISVIIRHEILHRYLNHFLRMERHLGKDKWDKRTPQEHRLSNIAADYEISNRGYTEKDKQVVRNIKLNGQTISGLVTEVDHPDWINLSEEEMYDKLVEEQKQKEQEAQQDIKQKQQSDSSSGENSDSDGTFLDDIDGTVNSKIIEVEDIEREANKISKDAQGRILDKDGKQIGQEEPDEEDSADSNSADASSSPDFDDTNNSNGDKVTNSSNAQNKKLADKAKKLANQAKEIQDELKNTDLDRKDIPKLDKKIKVILDAFADTQLEDKVLKETTRAILIDQSQQAEKKAAKLKKIDFIDYYASANIDNFLTDLNRLLKTQTNDEDFDRTYKRPSKNRVYGSTVLYKGRTRVDSMSVPVVDVYYDRSYSWQDASKTQAGDAAVSLLRTRYEKKGLIKLNIFYFGDSVSNSPTNVGSGTTVGDELLQNMVDTGATNIILLTDGDTNGNTYTLNVNIAGGVFILWADRKPTNLMNHIHGKKLNKLYEIKY